MDALPPNARQLGLAGLLPQVAALLAVWGGGPLAWTALAVAYGYAALIFSFLGGVWWGLALTRPNPVSWVMPVAVLPSLIALAGWLPWMVGWNWPGPELAILGGLIALSPLVDRAIGDMPEGWLGLRWRLSLGLGGLSLLIALHAAL